MGTELVTVSNAEYFRADMLSMEKNLRLAIKQLKETDEELYDKWECIAHAMLALRHIEDARMRMWKVIQYAWDGDSIYNK